MAIPDNVRAIVEMLDDLADATSFVYGIGYIRDIAATGFTSAAGMLGQLCTPPQWKQRVAAR